MGSHHQVCVDENTQITHRLIWVDRGPVDEQWRRGQLVSPYLMLYDFILFITNKVSPGGTARRYAPADGGSTAAKIAADPRPSADGSAVRTSLVTGGG